jgi:hypothetical protein
VTYLKKILPMIKQLGGTGVMIEWEDMFPFTARYIEDKFLFTTRCTEGMFPFTARYLEGMFLFTAGT